MVTGRARGGLRGEFYSKFVLVGADYVCMKYNVERSE
jgi:hypothetical protein